MFKYEKALEFYEKALKIRLKKLGEDHPDVAQTYNNMANVYENQSKYEKARNGESSDNVLVSMLKVKESYGCSAIESLDIVENALVTGINLNAL